MHQQGVGSHGGVMHISRGVGWEGGKLGGCTLAGSGKWEVAVGHMPQGGGQGGRPTGEQQMF